MLKLAAILLVLMIVFGVLGFVMHVAVALTKIAFFICLIGVAISWSARRCCGATGAFIVSILLTLRPPAASSHFRQ
jgi:hypothetical protein